jgi:hypothetical protein
METPDPHNAADRVGYRCMTGIGMPFGRPLQMQEAGCVLIMTYDDGRQWTSMVYLCVEVDHEVAC